MSESAVTIDLPCIQCGYNLRSLPWDTTCPECNTPVRRSEAPKGFLLASARDAQRLRRVLGLIILGVLIYTSAYICAAVSFMNALQMPRSWFRTCVATWQIGEPVGGIIQMLGLWQVANVLGQLGFVRTRFAVHAAGCFVVASLLFVVATLVWHYGLGPGRGPVVQFGFKYIQPLVWPSLGFALVLAFVSLPNVVNARTAPRLRGLMRLGLLAIFVPIHDVAYSITLVSNLFNNQVSSFPSPSYELFWWWRQHGYAACWIVLLSIIFICIRRLDLAMRA